MNIGGEGLMLSSWGQFPQEASDHPDDAPMRIWRVRVHGQVAGYIAVPGDDPFDALLAAESAFTEGLA